MLRRHRVYVSRVRNGKSETPDLNNSTLVCEGEKRGGFRFLNLDPGNWVTQPLVANEINKRWRRGTTRFVGACVS